MPDNLLALFNDAVLTSNVSQNWGINCAVVETEYIMERYVHLKR
jgi:hypothetical protein